MPQPGYVFRDGGTTPPPELNADEREFREPGTSSGTNNGSDKSHHGHLHLSLPLPRIHHHDTRSSSVNSSTRTSRDYHQTGDSPKARAFVINAATGHEKEEDEDEDDFRPAKLGASIERLYNSVGVDLVRFNEDLSRVRSWQDPVHTGAFAAVYALAWVFNAIVPTLFLGLLILTAAPEARSKVFPPPEADSEVGSSGSEHPDPDPATAASTTAANGSAKQSHNKTRKRELTEAPIRTHLLRPAMHTMNRISDTWERVANLLSPTPPFSHNKRIELAAMLIPISLLSLAITLQQVARTATFVFGLTFFSEPVIQHATDLLDTNHPGWRKYLDPRNTLLRGVPNNAELAIVLRAAGATNGAPVQVQERKKAVDMKSGPAWDIKDDNIMVTIENDSVLTTYVKHQKKNAQPKHIRSEDGRETYLSQGDFGPLQGTRLLPKLGDFNLAFPGLAEGNGHLAAIQSHRFRAPEVILGCPWSYSVDIWNLGLLMWNLMEDTSLFGRPAGEDGEYDAHVHLSQMVSVLGEPDQELVQRERDFRNYRLDKPVVNPRGKECTTMNEFWGGPFFNDQSNILRTDLVQQKKLADTITVLSGDEKEVFLDFASGMLQWLPEKRKTAARELLQHPIFNALNESRARWRE
ncbi:hypothetical protein DV735_g4902, partial [Chaetothyriales sp. CBS 134920]